MTQFRENVRTDRRKERRMEGWKDGQTLFHRIFLATAEDPKKLHMQQNLRKFCQNLASLLNVLSKMES